MLLDFWVLFWRKTFKKKRDMTIKMKEEKASEIYWETEINKGDGKTFDKLVYDELLSLEAKIELLTNMYDNALSDITKERYSTKRMWYEREYKQLIEQHKL